MALAGDADARQAHTAHRPVEVREDDAAGTHAGTTTAGRRILGAKGGSRAVGGRLRGAARSLADATRTAPVRPGAGDIVPAVRRAADARRPTRTQHAAHRHEGANRPRSG